MIICFYNNINCITNKKLAINKSMKRLLVFLLLVLLLCCVNLSCTQDLTLSKIFPNASVEIFTSTKTNLTEFYKLDNGFGEIIFGEVEDFEYIFNNVNNISGFTLKINIESFSKTKIFKALNVINYNENNFNILGFSNTVKKIFKNKFSLKIDKNECNFQYFEAKSHIFLGIPLILGSY